MLKIHHASYAIGTTEYPDATWLNVRRSTGVSDIWVTQGVTARCDDSHLIRVPLSSLGQFARLGALPDEAEALRVGAKTAQTATRCGVLGSGVGLLVGLLGILPLWPAVFGGGILGGLIGGICQFVPLNQTSRLDLLIGTLADLARDAHGASPQRIEFLQEIVCQTSTIFADTGRPGDDLCRVLLYLMENALHERNNAAG